MHNPLSKSKAFGFNISSPSHLFSLIRSESKLITISKILSFEWSESQRLCQPHQEPAKDERRTNDKKKERKIRNTDEIKEIKEKKRFDIQGAKQATN